MTLILKSALRGSQLGKSRRDLSAMRFSQGIAPRPERPCQLFPIRAGLAAFAPSG
jgi:hypothetical protein